ncbi:MAG: NAD-dependent epimerase/dehydratase family protein [Clostridia bacterium]|nr:NAD-dependent epimerase/dehydratase family protein [Clostridia bacterium]
MRKILITGAFGQIGTELSQVLQELYGFDNVVVSGLEHSVKEELIDGVLEVVDVTNGNQLLNVVKKYQVDTIIHLAALLSAVGEKYPQKLWDVNMNGLYNVLEVGRISGASIFTPSSIAAFGPTTPADNTPQDTIQRPSTIYGVSKVSGELLCDYYFLKYGVDTRGVRFPGLISNTALPGGGTTDYAVHIFYEAVKSKYFECNIAAGTYMDMMYMPDAIASIIKLMEADPSKLSHRNAFNISSMSIEPEDLRRAILKHIPDFEMIYKVDPVKQKIAMSWPNSLDDSLARAEWDFSPEYDLEKMTADMLTSLRKKI